MGEWTAVDRWGKVMKMLVKMTVMMMTPGGTLASPEARGRGPPFFFFFFDLLPSWEKGFPSGPGLTWRQRGESPSEIGSLSLSLSLSLCVCVCVCVCVCIVLVLSFS